MAGKDLENAFLEAAEIAKKLPKNLQEAGFNKAVEQILGKEGPTKAGSRQSREAAKKAQRTDDRGVSELLEAIDRTAYPDVGATARVGDRALKVLQLAHQNHDVDGLTAGEIATILSRKFRLPTKPNSVTVALDRETDTVDVRSGAGASRVFHIMAPGEEYLKKLRAGEDVGRRRRGAAGKKTTKKASGRRKKATTEKAPATKKSAGRKEATAEKKAVSKKVTRRPGPKAAIGQLLNAGFFRSARTISEIQEELQHRRGHGYSVQELAPALVRSIRDESLSRERNGEGQYEYSQA
jgi:hypothetical protein